MTRRRFLRVSGAGAITGSALLAGACGDDSGPAPRTKDDADVADVEVLNGVLDLELKSIAAYKAGAAALSGTPLRTVKLFLEHEQQHVDVLSRAIEDAGGMPNEARSSYRFGRLASEDAVLQYAVSLENDQLAAYIDALPKISDGGVRGAIASILTTEAEHVCVLRTALGVAPAPSAFVTGAER